MRDRSPGTRVASVTGASAGIGKAIVRRLLTGYSRAASPDVVARVVSRAVNSRRPRRRDATPLDAKVLIVLKRLLPDWAWERLLRAALGREPTAAKRPSAKAG